MVPSIAQVLNGIARTLLMDVLPQTAHAYVAQTLQLDAMLAMMCAQEFDRAAARLADENAALLALFSDAEAIVTDDTLRAELRAAGTAAPSGLLVSQLQDRNRTLRGLLVRVHEHVESLPDASALHERIWAELRESTRRRQLELEMPS
jgi:hypothetical protein